MARQQARSVVALALAFSSILPVTASAQPARQPNPNAPRLMVGVFRNTDKKLGPDAAEAARSRISSDVSLRDLWVIPKNDIIATLDASGYSTTDALSPSDAAALGKLLRADMFIDGSVTKTATGVTIEGALVLTRDLNLVQPLGTFEGKNVDAAADKMSRAFQDAFKQISFEKKCTQASREGKPADVAAAAVAGIAAYPKAILVRVCLLNSLVDQKRPAAEILKVVDEILAVDAKSRPALSAAVIAYDMSGNADKKIEMLTQLLAADPTNAKLQVQVVNELASSGKAALALPIIEKTVAENPGDAAMAKLYFLILGATKNYKTMAAIGEKLAEMDTASVDQQFFEKMAAAYAADSQPAKAAEVAARATAKFPKVASLWVARGTLERRAGQVQKSVESLKRALAVDPKVEGARMAIINSFVEQNQLDSAFVGMHDAWKAGEEPNLIGTFALTIGNRLYKAASQTKTIADYEKALPYLTFADSVTKEAQTKQNAKFLIGVSSFFMGQIAATEAPKTKSCELARKASDAFVQAQINLPAGGAINPQITQQLLSAIPQFLPAVDGQVKAFCK